MNSRQTGRQTGKQKVAVREFYNDKCMLLTGVTGFLGKVLVERLLSTIPRIGKLYILIRPKKNITLQDRLHKEIFSTELFKPLFKSRPDIRQIINERVIAIKGDLMEENLGMDPQVYK